jgi:exopolyphosphatase / guanosine-5'-triphosphate,3'-diphosphate pyrophosphatase
MVRLGVLDLGSNSFHLLVAEVAGGEVRRIASDKRMVRLAEGTLATGEIAGEAWERGMAAVGELVASVGGGVPVIGIATSAIREAANGAAFVETARRRWPIDLRIVSGAEEARLAFLGVTGGVGEEPVCVVDLGGGSAQIAVGSPGSAPRFRTSLPLGVLRLRDRFLDAEARMTDRGRVAIAAEVTRWAGPVAAEVRAIGPRAVHIVSGTARQLGLVALRFGWSDGVTLSARVLARLSSLLGGWGADEIAALGVEAGRSDTVATGALVLSTLTELFEVPGVTLAQRGVREGAALDAVGARRQRTSGSQPERAIP